MEKEELWDLKWLCRNLWLDHKKVENQFPTMKETGKSIRKTFYMFVKMTI